MSGTLDYRVQPGGTLTGRIQVPGDKSISHRAVMLSAVAEGTSHIQGLLEGEDVLATLRAFRAMGVKVEGPSAGTCVIHGAGAGGLHNPQQALDLGNSGTALRLLVGLLAARNIRAELVGDESLSRRPMHRVTEPLHAMGAHIATAQEGTPPLYIEPAGTLKGIDYQMPVASAQVKSALLLAGLSAHGTTCVQEPFPTRDHTERLLTGFGHPCRHTDAGICIEGNGVLTATDVEIPGDISSAAFLLVGAVIAPGSEITITGVGVNPTRTGVITILQAMGAQIDLANQHDICGEPVADISVRYGELTGIDISPHEASSAIDELPVLCVAAACAHGITTIRGAEELRHKESDRIATMTVLLRALNIEVEEKIDGMVIHGGVMTGGSVNSQGDHRVAMAACIAGLRAQQAIAVKDCANIATSFPGFRELSQQIGLRIE